MSVTKAMQAYPTVTTVNYIKKLEAKIEKLTKRNFELELKLWRARLNHTAALPAIKEKP